MILTQYVIGMTDGLGDNSVDVDIKLLNGDTLVDSVSTNGADEAGQFTYTQDGSPGRVYCVATNGGQTRRLYGATSEQLPGGWTTGELPDLFDNWLPGVLQDLDNNLAVAAPGGMFVSIDSGGGVLRGQLYRKFSGAATGKLAVAANATGSTRSDLVVMQVKRSGSDAGKASLVYKVGDTSLSQGSVTWEEALAQVDVPNGAAAITSGMITDLRQYAISRSIDKGVLPAASAQSSSDTASTTDTATFQDAMVFTVTVPRGVWSVTGISGLQLKRTTNGQATWRLKISSDTGTARSLTLDAGEWETLVDNHAFQLNGGRDVTISVQYRNVDAGTTSARNPWCWLTLIRTGNQ